LSVNETHVYSNSSFTFDISEFNPTANSINLSRSDDWYSESLSAWPCGEGTIPFGVAAYRGYYTLQNVSSAHGILKLAPSLCIYIANATTYMAPPLSTFRPPYGFGSLQVYAISGGSVSSGNFSEFVNSLGSSKPAVYTLAVGDEWGDFVLLHFSVVELPSSLPLTTCSDILC
jgi:hypothetical protein